MRILILTAVLALSACSSLDTPEQKYYALNGAITATGRVVQAYVSECLPKPATDPCKPNLPKINTAAKKLQEVLAQSDRVFVTHDSQYYDLSLSVTENALLDLQSIIKE